MAGVTCGTCGNELDAASTQCPFCGEMQPGRIGVVTPRHRAVNLEKGKPRVEDALKRLEQELTLAETGGYRVLTLIHGYGSSGEGGAIRQEVRRQLCYFHQQGRINDYLYGEEFVRTGPHARHLLRRFPFLFDHPDLNRGNRGITLVILSAGRKKDKSS